MIHTTSIIYGIKILTNSRQKTVLRHYLDKAYELADECVAFYRYGLTSWTRGKCTTSTDNVDEQNESFTLYPNPSSGIFRIKMTNDLTTLGPCTVDLLNPNGSLLRSQRYDNVSGITMDIRGFPNGVYFVRLRSTRGMAVKKLIKY